ncbi:MAG: DUF2029 domain-containing protein, partial [Acidimicrobiia bacterium]|nr:DUF2029 domain-containing protein [Acidimicrobiia bacterium]
INPAIVTVVSGGHNDLLVGAALLAGVLAALDGRAAKAGVLLALAVLVKIAAVLPLGAVIAWIAVRHGRRAGARAAATSGVAIVAGYAMAGGTAALAPLKLASTWHSKASLWTFPTSWIERTLLGVHPGQSHVLATTAMVVVVLIGVVVAAPRLRDLDPAMAAGGAAFVYLLGAAYVLPWYAGWVVPVVALAWRSRLALLAQLQASILLLIYVDRPGVHSTAFHDVVGTLSTHVVPVVEGLILLALVVVSTRRLAGLAARAAA